MTHFLYCFFFPLIVTLSKKRHVLILFFYFTKSIIWFSVLYHQYYKSSAILEKCALFLSPFFLYLFPYFFLSFFLTSLSFLSFIKEWNDLHCNQIGTLTSEHPREVMHWSISSVRHTYCLSIWPLSLETYFLLFSLSIVLFVLWRY